MNQDTDIRGYYLAGYSLDQTGAIVGCDSKTVRRRLVAMGVEIRPSNNVKRSKWLTEKAKE